MENDCIFTWMKKYIFIYIRIYLYVYYSIYEYIFILVTNRFFFFFKEQHRKIKLLHFSKASHQSWGVEELQDRPRFWEYQGAPCPCLVFHPFQLDVGLNFID